MLWSVGSTVIAPMASELAESIRAVQVAPPSRVRYSPPCAVPTYTVLPEASTGSMAMAVTLPLTGTVGDVCPLGMGDGPSAVQVGETRGPAPDTADLVCMRRMDCSWSCRLRMARDRACGSFTRSSSPRCRRSCWSRNCRYSFELVRLRAKGGMSGLSSSSSSAGAAGFALGGALEAAGAVGAGLCDGAPCAQHAVTTNTKMMAVKNDIQERGIAEIPLLSSGTVICWGEASKRGHSFPRAGISKEHIVFSPE